MKSDALKKHHFWLLFGAVPLLVGLLVIMLYTGPADAIAQQAGEYKKSSDAVGSAKAQGTGMIAGLGEQKTVLEERRGQLWGVNYERQKAEGVFAWPIAGRDNYLKALEKLDLRFGAKEVSSPEAGKEPDTQFVVLNDEMAKFTASTNYIESYNRLASTIAPTRFEGSWQSVLRHVTNWISDSSPGGRPGSNLFWLALEDFWIQRALLKPVAEVNANAAKFELVKPAVETAETRLKRKFQNRTWEIDIEVAREGANTVLKSKLKNKTDRLQMLGLNKTMRLKVWLDDPKISTSQYFEYRIGGELVKGSGELTPKVVPEIHKIPAGTEPVEIFAVEQILDEITVPVRLVRKVELGFRDSKRSAAELKMPSFFPEDAVAAEPAVGAENGMLPGGPPSGSGYGGPGGIGATAVATRIGTAEQVLNANRKRYIERTEQVRRMPIGVVLVVDQAFVNDVLIAIGNSPLRIQITQTQWQRFRDPLAVGAAPPSGPGGFGAPPSSFGGEEDPQDGGGPRGSSSFSPPPMFPGSGTGAATGALPQSQVTAGLVELAVYGMVSLYEKASAKPVELKNAEPKPDQPAPMKPMVKPDEPKPPPAKPEEPKPDAPKTEVPAPKPPAVAPTAPPK